MYCCELTGEGGSALCIFYALYTPTLELLVGLGGLCRWHPAFADCTVVPYIVPSQLGPVVPTWGRSLFIDRSRARIHGSALHQFWCSEFFPILAQYRACWAAVQVIGSLARLLLLVAPGPGSAFEECYTWPHCCSSWTTVFVFCSYRRESTMCGYNNA